MLRDSRSIFYLFKAVITDNLAAGCGCHRTGWISQRPVLSLHNWAGNSLTTALFDLGGSVVLLGSRLAAGA